MEASWAEKRAYVQSAVDALEGTSLASSAHARLQALRPTLPDLTAWSPVRDAGQPIETAHFRVQFDPVTGALISLEARTDHRAWAAADHPLGWLRYQTFSAADYERFFDQYIIPAERANSWTRDDFTKPGIESANPPSRFWQPTVDACYRQSSDTESRFLFHLSAEPPSALDYGCPKDFYLLYTFDNHLPRIDIDLQWFNKLACRLPEALWFSFQPRVSPDAQWHMEKLGQEISPLEVVENGNRHLHAVGKGVTCSEAGSHLAIAALDSPLVAPGQPSLLNFTNEQPQLRLGMHFNLFNNVWGTNFPMWFEEDCRFRFQLTFDNRKPAY
jgi:hypothetical protein